MCRLDGNKRGIIAGSWSKKGDKWVIGTGSKLVYIGQYDENQNWWDSKLMKGFKSSILSVKLCFSIKFNFSLNLNLVIR